MSKVVTNGIQFGNVANAGSTVLDWYEEGTFTPVIIGGTTAGVGTYAHSNGNFVRVGNVVTFRLRTTWTAHTGSGTTMMTGLPYNNLVIGDCSFITMGYGWSAPACLYVWSGGSRFYLQNGSGTFGDISNIVTNAAVIVSGSYILS